MRFVNNFSIFLCLFLLDGISSHEPDAQVNAFHQGLNIQITGIPSDTDSSQCPEQYCKVGKAGPKGTPGEKGEKGDAAEVCECITNQQLLDRINNLETLLHAVESKTTDLERSLVSKTSRDCEDIQSVTPSLAAGVYSINLSGSETQVYCDVDEDDGRMWTVIQKRFDGSEDFFRGWDDYVNGFGNRDSEYWLGLDNIHSLTGDGQYSLKITIEDWAGVKKDALYSEFIVGNKASDYRLTIGGYSGTGGDSLIYHNGQKFSTKDHDVDSHSTHNYNCADKFQGAWWYKGCHNSNLNGLYLRGDERSSATGMVWYHFNGRYYSMKSAEMKLRKKA